MAVFSKKKEENEDSKQVFDIGNSDVQELKQMIAELSNQNKDLVQSVTDLKNENAKILAEEKEKQLNLRIENCAKDFGVKDDEGALILKVEEESPAEEAGLKAGDVIVQMEAKNISEPKDVSDILSDLEEGDEVTIQVIRHKKKKSVKAELEERPGFRNIKIFKDIGDKIHSSLPYFHSSIPDFEDCIHIRVEKLNRKLEEKLKGVEEKVQKKLKYLKEYTYI